MVRPLSLSALPLALLASCVAYRPAPIDVVVLAHATPPAPAGPLAYPQAVRFALEHNPDLLALRARAAAVNRSAFLEEIGSESSEGVSVDVIGLLRLGEHGTQRTLADARFSEAVLRHRERAWEIALEIAEAYEVDRALSGLPLPDVTLPVDSYVRAGLAPASARDAADANAQSLRAEEEERRAQARENRVTLLRLLGVAPDAPAAGFRPTGDTGLPDDVRVPSRDVLLRARPDLQREVATYRVADQEFRRAVAEQYPHLTVEPPLDGEIGWNLLGVTLPFRAPSEARAAWALREAARLEAKAAVLDALEEAEAAATAARAASSGLLAARARADASAALLSTARTRLEAESGAFFEAVFTAGDAVEASMSLREAAVVRARARARAARAVGWPTSHGIPVSLLPVGPCR